MFASAKGIHNPVQTKVESDKSSSKIPWLKVLVNTSWGVLCVVEWVYYSLWLAIYDKGRVDAFQAVEEEDRDRW